MNFQFEYKNPIACVTISIFFPPCPSADLKLLEEATISVCKSLGEKWWHLNFFPCGVSKKIKKWHPCV